jgi:hypothetical protein
MDYKNHNIEGLQFLYYWETSVLELNGSVNIHRIDLKWIE